MQVAEWPRKEWRGINEITIMVDKHIELISPDYGRIKTDKKDTKQLARKTYKQLEILYLDKLEAVKDYERRMKVAVKKGDIEDKDYLVELTPANMWNDFRPVFYSRSDEQEQYLYDLIDIHTGWVITRTFKHDCKKFVDLLAAEEFTFTGEFLEDVEKWSGLKRYTEKQMVGVYRGNSGGTIRAYQKLTVKDN